MTSKTGPAPQASLLVFGNGDLLVAIKPFNENPLDLQINDTGDIRADGKLIGTIPAGLLAQSLLEGVPVMDTRTREIGLYFPSGRAHP